LQRVEGAAQQLFGAFDALAVNDVPEDGEIVLLAAPIEVEEVTLEKIESIANLEPRGVFARNRSHLGIIDHRGACFAQRSGKRNRPCGRAAADVENPL